MLVANRLVKNSKRLGLNVLLLIYINLKIMKFSKSYIFFDTFSL